MGSVSGGLFCAYALQVKKVLSSWAIAKDLLHQVWPLYSTKKMLRASA
jgi:hypothetical protein